MNEIIQQGLRAFMWMVCFPPRHKCIWRFLWAFPSNADQVYSTRNINTNWKNLWNPNVQYMYLFYCFTIVLFSLGILQALYFSLIRSRCIFLFRSKFDDIVGWAEMISRVTPIQKNHRDKLSASKNRCVHLLGMHWIFAMLCSHSLIIQV